MWERLFFVYKLFEFQVEKETWARKLVKHFWVELFKVNLECLQQQQQQHKKYNINNVKNEIENINFKYFMY